MTSPDPKNGAAAPRARTGRPHQAQPGMAERRRRSGLRVALVGEGAYPFYPGGVSLWAHELVTGMPEHAFTAVALTVWGNEPLGWELPENLTRVVNIPLWARASRRRTKNRKSAAFPKLHEAFLRSFISTPTRQEDRQAEPGEQFVSATRDLFEFAQSHELSSALVSDEAIDRILRVWCEARAASPRPLPAMNLHDAVVLADRIEHMLRPLSHAPVRADVCQLTMNGLSVLVGLASKWVHGTPMVMSEHGMYLRERYLGFADDHTSHTVQVVLARFFGALTGAGYRCADLLTPHSNYNRRWQLRGGASEAQVHTMYNGVDPAKYPVAERDPDLPTIVFLGRIDPLKDLHTLIRAFQIVRVEVPNARLRMFGPVPAGNDDYYASCLELIKKLQLADGAVFEGWAPRQVDAYHAGHLVALTSVSEGFPSTVLESMATGRPQVCTNVGGVAEAVGSAGFMVTPRDVAGVARACIQLLTDVELRHTLGDRARRRVIERFTLAQWTDAYRAVYERQAYPRTVPKPTMGAASAGYGASIQGAAT